MYCDVIVQMTHYKGGNKNVKQSDDDIFVMVWVCGGLRLDRDHLFFVCYWDWIALIQSRSFDHVDCDVAEMERVDVDVGESWWLMMARVWLSFGCFWWESMENGLEMDAGDCACSINQYSSNRTVSEWACMNWVKLLTKSLLNCSRYDELFAFLILWEQLSWMILIEIT